MWGYVMVLLWCDFMGIHLVSISVKPDDILRVKAVPHSIHYFGRFRFTQNTLQQAGPCFRWECASHVLLFVLQCYKVLPQFIEHWLYEYSLLWRYYCVGCNHSYREVKLCAVVQAECERMWWIFGRIAIRRHLWNNPRPKDFVKAMYVRSSVFLYYVFLCLSRTLVKLLRFSSLR